MSEAGGTFAFVQLEFGFLLGPADGRYLVRQAPEAAPDHILVLTTVGAERRSPRGRRGSSVTGATPEPVPTARITVIDAEPFPDQGSAEGWLSEARRTGDRTDSEVRSAVRVANRALQAYRAAASDPYAHDVSADHALVVRLGFGRGEAVAKGHYQAAWERPAGIRERPHRSMEAPDERFAALIGAREPLLVCEELVLRARADLTAGRLREAALQARVALESLLSELSEALAGELRAALAADRTPVGEAANEALWGPLDDGSAQAVAAAVGRMEAALRVRRLGGAS
ncbi:MAG TPA: hypothetical protein VGV10_04265 [Thermoleophilaceae bacterium]|nr:hypothetical protein [Thermoleophilaceae bacterium]